MEGFLVRVTQLEPNHRQGFHLMIHGADRFKASKVYKENPLPHEEAKQPELWIAEGNIIRDLDRTDLIQKYE